MYAFVASHGRPKVEGAIQFEASNLNEICIHTELRVMSVVRESSSRSSATSSGLGNNMIQHQESGGHCIC